QTSTLRIDRLQPPTSPESTTAIESGPNAEQVKLAPQRLRSNTAGQLVIDVELPAGYHLNPSAPQRYRVSIDAGSRQLSLHPDSGKGGDDEVAQTSKGLKLPLRIPIRSLAMGNAEIRVQLTLFYCREDNTGTCQIKTLVWVAPIEVVDDPTAFNEIRAHSKIEEAGKF
ncbi:MAG TPA: hypothetical protein VIV66_01355, partial [Pyrinomonadaceae bacterium]